jgi:hypothetical protein
MATVDGVVTLPDAHGVVQGNGGLVDRMAGDAGNNRLEGHAALNLYFGGGGNDTFIIADKFAVAGHVVNVKDTHFLNQTTYINDFHGAGTSTGEQDFIAFQDYVPGSLTLQHTGTSGTPGAVLYFYTVEDTSGNTHNLLVNSLNGNPIGQGDFAFVGLTA